jgi:hypothetical protein
MAKLLVSVVFWLTLSGCASVKLNVTALEQTDCAATTPVAKAGLLGLDGGDASQHLDAPSSPFLSNPPAVEQFRNHLAHVQQATNSSHSEATYKTLLRLVPYSDDLTNRQSSSLESAAETRNLHLLLNELSPSIIADEKMRLALSNAKTQFSKATLATISTKEDINQKLSRILQVGGDDTLVLYSAADLALKLSDYSVGLSGLSPSARSARVAALQEAVANYQAARFLRTYFKVYFRGGKVFQTQLKVDEFTSRAMEVVKGQVKLDPKDEAALDAKLKDVLSKVCTSNGDAGCLLTSLGKDKLVTRSGESLQFKGVSLWLGYEHRVQATWDYPKSAELAPQLVRVFVEAVFDSMKGRPAAVSTSTACSTTPPLFAANECLASSAQASTGSLQDIVTSVDEKASRADSFASVATGQIIRGVSLAALNNEALAKSAENFAGVLARKVVERAAWQQSGGGQCLTSSPSVAVEVAKN